jgi:hypothetical protein
MALSNMSGAGVHGMQSHADLKGRVEKCRMCADNSGAQRKVIRPSNFQGFDFRPHNINQVDKMMPLYDKWMRQLGPGE